MIISNDSRSLQRWPLTDLIDGAGHGAADLKGVGLIGHGPRERHLPRRVLHLQK
jgi:hypothetical protein